MNGLELITRLSSQVNVEGRGLFARPSGAETNPEAERYQNSLEARRAPLGHGREFGPHDRPHDITSRTRMSAAQEPTARRSLGTLIDGSKEVGHGQRTVPARL